MHTVSVKSPEDRVPHSRSHTQSYQGGRLLSPSILCTHALPHLLCHGSQLHWAQGPIFSPKTKVSILMCLSPSLLSSLSVCVHSPSMVQLPTASVGGASGSQGSRLNSSCPRELLLRTSFVLPVRADREEGLTDCPSPIGCRISYALP